MNIFLLDDGRLRSGWRFALAAFLVVVANYVSGNLSVLIAGRHRRIEEVIYRPLLMVLLLLAFLFVTRLFDQPKGSIWAYNGLPRRGWLRETAVGALLGFVMVSIAVVVMGLVGDLDISISVNMKAIVTAMVIFVVLLFAAMAEELMFRGYPFQRLVEGLGPIGAILVVSALFGAVHMQNPHVSENRWVQVFAFSNTLCIGVVLAIAYLRSKALWLPWGLHFGWNATLGMVYGLPVSGISQFSVVIKSKASGPEWLMGGRYGLEGGFLGTLVILLGLIYVLGFVKRPVEVPAPVDELASGGIQPHSGF
jgi:membrane protease YdiL (CAAX protease family)